jgi:hypothetical protein
MMFEFVWQNGTTKFLFTGWIGDKITGSPGLKCRDFPKLFSLQPIREKAHYITNILSSLAALKWISEHRHKKIITTFSCIKKSLTQSLLHFLHIPTIMTHPIPSQPWNPKTSSRHVPPTDSHARLPSSRRPSAWSANSFSPGNGHLCRHDDSNPLSGVYNNK